MPKTRPGLSEPCYDYILNMIMTKKLMPGDRVPEIKIAEELEVSRTPVREALRKLADEGLVTVFPNRFTQVIEFREDEIFSIGAVRIALETMAVRLASFYSSQADFLQLRELAERSYQCALKGEDQNCRSYDDKYHAELARLSQNPFIIKYHNELRLKVNFIILHKPNFIIDEIEHLRTHIEIVDALIAHDVEKACAATQEVLFSFYHMKEQFPPAFLGSK